MGRVRQEIGAARLQSIAERFRAMLISTTVCGLHPSASPTLGDEDVAYRAAVLQVHAELASVAASVWTSGRNDGDRTTIQKLE